MRASTHRQNRVGGWFGMVVALTLLELAMVGSAWGGTLIADETDMNTEIANANDTPTNVIWQITGDILATPGGAGTVIPQWILQGGGTGNYPYNIGTFTSPFADVKIVGDKGGTGGAATLGYTGNAGGNAPVLSIINVTNDVELENLIITGGRLANGAYDSYFGGAGLYLGAVNNAAGAGIGIDDAGNTFTGYGPGFTTATLKNMTFTDNHIAVGMGDRAVMGGGAFVDATDYSAAYTTGGTISLATVNFRDNSVTVGTSTTSTTIASAFGGGLRVKNATAFTYAGGEVSGNQVTNMGGSHAHGGGVVVDDYTQSATFSNVLFSGNTATMNGKSTAVTESWARGGGFYGYYDTNAAATDQLNLVFDQGTSFIGNQAVARNNTAAYAAGGGVALNMIRGAAAFTGVVFQDNVASSANGMAQGGGLAVIASAIANGAVTMTDSSFIGNQANGSTTANSLGGAIYANTGNGALILNFNASAGGAAVISGNTAKGVASGVYFEGANAATFNLGALAGGSIQMLDPITARTAAAFAMVKSGAGSLTWGGGNLFAAGAGSTVTLGGGTTTFADDFTAVAGAGTRMDVAVNETTLFSTQRGSNLALFDYTAAGATGGLTVGAAGSIGATTVNADKTLFSFSQDYLVVDGLDATAALAGAEGANVSGFYLRTVGGVAQTWTTISYSSQYQWEIARANANAASGMTAIGQLMGQDWISDAQAREIGYDLDNAVPGFYLNMGHVGLAGVESAAIHAKRYGLPGWGGDRNIDTYAGVSSTSGLANTYGMAPHNGLRFWAGYIGDFDRHDSHGRYFGYKADRHGFVAGLNYDIGEIASVGFFGGYTHTKTDAKTLDSEVKSDAGHFGVIAAVAPVPMLPNLGFNIDLGYTFTDNDARRGVGAGGKATGSFDQNLFTAGLEVAYKLSLLNCLSVTPYVSARYGYVDQDGMDEAGFTAAHLDKFNDSEFNTKVGVGAGYELRLPGATVTPNLNLAWRHDYGSRQYGANAFYQGVANPVAYRQRSVKGDRDSMDLGVGLRAVKELSGNKQLGVNLGYNVNVGRRHDDHSLSAGFDLGF